MMNNIAQQIGLLLSAYDGIHYHFKMLPNGNLLCGATQQLIKKTNDVLGNPSYEVANCESCLRFMHLKDSNEIVLLSPVE